VTKRSCCPLWGTNEEVNEDVMVKMVTTLLLLKIFQQMCCYCHYLLKVHPFVNNLFNFLVKGFKANIYIYRFLKWRDGSLDMRLNFIDGDRQRGKK